MPPADAHWVYEVECQNAAGDVIALVVELTREERQDQLLNHAIGRACAAAVDAGPIVNSYVLGHAWKIVPQGYEPISGTIKRVQAQNVRALH